MAAMLLEWIFTSIFLILVVMALRAALGRRMSAGLRYGLWAVVLVRLLVPVQMFTSPIAGMWAFTEVRTERNIARPSDTLDASCGVGGEDILDALGRQDGPSAVLNTFPQAPDPPTVPDAPEPPDLNNLPGWTGYLGWAWLAGGAVVALVLLLSNLRFAQRLRRERIPLEDAGCPLRVYVAGLPSPCLFGIFRPAIYATPEAEDPDMLRHVLAHEYTHYRHGDHLWSLLRCAALAVHWWNPLVWLAARLSQQDAELACDEGALKRLGDGERAAYGGTLLALVTAKPRPGDLFRCATTMTGDKKSLKERVSRIACAPKRILWAAAAAVLVTVLACACAFGQAAEPADDVDGDIEFELDFSMNENGLVDITGTVDGMVLRQGTFWQPTGAPARTLSMRYAPFDDGIEGFLTAWWEGPTSVGVTTNTMAWLSSYAPSGYWNFTVELSGEKAAVARMAAETLNVPEGAETWETRMYPGSISDEEAVRAARIAAVLMREAEDYYRDTMGERQTLSPAPDLNRDGVPETLWVAEFGMAKRLEVWEGDELLWSDEGSSSHAGWNAVFLCTLEGEDYLLRYHPYMSQGWCGYEYQLFTLENGRETMAAERYIEFDINFGTLMHESFEPETIAAFMDEVNALLADSVQLINTDSELLATFEKEGRLVDTLYWLEGGEPPFVRDESKSLLENLRDYKEAMAKQWYAETPSVFPVDELGTDILLRYKAEQARFAGQWDYNFQSAESVDAQVIDLNGDGRDEIVFSLVRGRGAGTHIEQLYVFDAGTLEQYDTSGLNEMILAQIQSTGDEDNFYLSALGMEAAISKREAKRRNEDAPLAEALGLGGIIRYTIGDGGTVRCGLDCDASGALTNYIGRVEVTLGFTGSGFQGLKAEYTSIVLYD